MERKNFSEVSRMIEEIEKKNVELEDLLSKFSFFSRKKILQEITQNIIKGSPILKQMGVNQELIMPQEEYEEPMLFHAIIDNTIDEIKADPTKKLIFLKNLLNKMPDISENDKNVILQSLKDEKIEKLKEKILSLVKVFKLQL